MGKLMLFIAGCLAIAGNVAWPWFLLIGVILL